MTIPNGWTTVGPNGPWGLGTEPFSVDVPFGVRYTDAFGNRCVAQPDGTLSVEGLGVGVNAGKPDGEWWPYSELLAAGPTNAAPWVGSATTDSAPAEEGPAPTPTPTPAPAPAPVAPPVTESAAAVVPIAHVAAVASAWDRMKAELHLMDHEAVVAFERAFAELRRLL